MLHICSVRNGHIRKVFAALYKFSGLVSDKRDIYEELVSTPHYCPSATIVEQAPYSGAWQLLSIKELSEKLQEILDQGVMQFRSGGVEKCLEVFYLCTGRSYVLLRTLRRRGLMEL